MPATAVNSLKYVRGYIDSIGHNVEGKDANLESLLGKTVRLYILVQDADLHGFRFK